MEAYFGATLGVLAVSHLTFFVAAWIKRNDLADTAWGLGFVAAAIGAVIFKSQDALFSLGSNEKLLLICLGLWAFRLAYYITLRTFSHSHEDARYQKMRDGWGQQWLIKSYLIVFVLQGSLLLLVVSPIIAAIDRSPTEIDTRSLIGFLVWLVGFTFETVSDFQLKKFKQDPANKGRIMDQGLWAWSRHPNYFGEVTLWWGLYIISSSGVSGLWFIFSPVLMTYLILKFSGVSMLEGLMESRPGFKEYQQRTSRFFPWPPKK